MLKNTENIALRSSQIFYLLVLRVKIVTIFESKVVTISARHTIIRKFANFVRLNFPHITTFFNQILEFYYFCSFWEFRFYCLDQKLVYNAIVHSD